jgi:lysozyme family protein
VTNYNDFRKALAFVLPWEGGYVNDPDDPGGETKWGISKKAHPFEDIALLSPERAAQIYADEYWTPLGCDGIEFPLNVAVFDTAVNCGVKRAADWLKRSTNAIEFLDFRKVHYYSLVNKNPTMSKYLRGWMNRLGDLKKYVEINQKQS